MNQQADCWSIIPATGIGQRMLADRPKQYLQLAGKTILEHTLDNLLSHEAIQGVVLILHAEDEYWSELGYKHKKPILVCQGGKERHHSVFNGLNYLKSHSAQDVYVLIHDAVRPFVQHDDLYRLIDAIQSSNDGAILAAPIADTLKFSSGEQKIANTHPRQGLWSAFTPQAFRLSLILSALGEVIEKGLEITDDASAMELAGYHPRLIDSDSRNIKITRPEDLILAEAILASQNSAN